MEFLSIWIITAIIFAIVAVGLLGITKIMDVISEKLPNPYDTIIPITLLIALGSLIITIIMTIGGN